MYIFIYIFIQVYNLIWYFESNFFIILKDFMSWIQGICPFHIIYIRKVANAIGRQADSTW